MRAITPALFRLAVLTTLLAQTGCKTRSEIRREQELERIKHEVTQVRGTRADLETQLDDLRTEVGRLAAVVDEQLGQQRGQTDDLKKEMLALGQRIQAMEQRIVEADVSERRHQEERSRASFDNGKKLYDEERFEESAAIFEAVAKGKARTDEGKRAQFFLGEAHFGSKDYASAALAFGEFIKGYPKDDLVPTAIYRQAQAFRNMGKGKEAKLFYQELVDRFPKSKLAGKAKAEMKKIK